MTDQFFEQPILNPPDEYSARHWVPGVNNLGGFERWAFAEFTTVFEIESEFNKLVERLTQLSST